jgi:glycosyltransferase involved in cell wall biosynthesis
MPIAKKNILFLSAFSKIGGAERVLLIIAENIINDGYSPYLIAQEEGPLTESFIKLGGKVYILKLPAWRKFKNMFKRYLAIRRIAAIVRSERIDLVYANAYRLNPYCLGVALICKIKAVTHVHDIIKRKHVINFLLHKSKYLVVPSNFVRAHLGNIKAKVFVVSNAIDVGKFSNIQTGNIRREFGISSGAFLIVMVANFVERKGHKFFIEVASKLKSMAEDVKFMIVGDSVYGGPLTMGALKKIAREKNAESSIIFTGARNDIPEILNASDLLVVPSEIEPFSLAAIEAMAVKLPVIANIKSGGPTEIIDDGITGILVDCSDTDALVEAVLKLIRNQPLRRNLAEAGYKKAKEKFDIPIFMSNIQKLLQEVLP